MFLMLKHRIGSSELVVGATSAEQSVRNTNELGMSHCEILDSCST